MRAGEKQCCPAYPASCVSVRPHCALRAVCGLVGLVLLPGFIVRGKAVHRSAHAYLEKFHRRQLGRVGRWAFGQFPDQIPGLLQPAILHRAAKFAGEVGGLSQAVAVCFDKLVLSQGKLRNAVL